MFLGIENRQSLPRYDFAGGDGFNHCNPSSNGRIGQRLCKNTLVVAGTRLTIKFFSYLDQKPVYEPWMGSICWNSLPRRPIHNMRTKKARVASINASIPMARHLNAAVIVALTETGFTSRLISKYRPDCPILSNTSSPAVVRRLTLNWGVFGIRYEGDGSDEGKLQFAI